MKLEAHLTNIRSLVAQKRLEFEFGGAPDDGALDALNREIAEVIGAPAPSELAVWFRFCNGGHGTYRLIPSGSWLPMTLAETTKVWRFFRNPKSEYLGSYEAKWLPLFGNGMGDHLVLDLVSGALIEYWHDDADRPKVHDSLLDLVVAVEVALQAYTPSQDAEALIKKAKPEGLSLVVAQRKAAKNMALAKTIRELTGDPLMDVVRGLDKAYPDAIYRVDLAPLGGNQARADAVQRVRDVATAVVDSGSELVLRVIAADGREEDAQPEDLNDLMRRCTSF